ncbi:MAG: hypothetical protein Q8O52_28355 [Sulfuritalea sp.]|nr:hypothetical protein [Sulfuritalea sp.]
MSRFGSGPSWCIILAMASGAGTVLGQNRSSAGTIQPIAPTAASAPAVDAAGKAVDQRTRKAIAKNGAPRIQPKRQIKSPPLPKPQLKAQTKIKLQAKSSRSDRPQPPVPSNIHSTGVDQCWQQIQAAVQPAKLIRLSEECERDFPASQFAAQIRVIGARARQALDIQRSIGLSGDFFEDSIGDAAYRDNLGKAVRGDKDAAYLIALAYRIGMSGVAASSRRMEQWLRFSAELGSGLASWELAEFYNYGGFVADAARFEKKALELGYRPPFRLPTRGY